MLPELPLCGGVPGVLSCRGASACEAGLCLFGHALQQAVAHCVLQHFACISKPMRAFIVRASSAEMLGRLPLQF
eukprot:1160805-Pelagomonas_calceolata.AAC.5